MFTDGPLVGATLDRNGLRPARWLITDDDRVILASETGVIDVPPEQVRKKGRLQPGRMFLVDTVEGRIVDDDEVKRDVTGRWPYRQWLNRNVFTFDELPRVPAPPRARRATSCGRRSARSATPTRTCALVLAPMAETGKEPVGSMGTDTPLAVLSDQAPTLFRYFHQLFAQVTNPPIDPIREALVMTLETTIGPDGNTLRGDAGAVPPARAARPDPHQRRAGPARRASATRACSSPGGSPLLFDVGRRRGRAGAAVERLCARRGRGGRRRATTSSS